MGKLELDKLKVQSFVTSLEGDQSKTVKGGETNDDTVCDWTEGGGVISCMSECGPPVYSDECDSFGGVCALTEADPCIEEPE